MQINKLKAVNKNLSRFVGRFTNWFGDSSSDEGLYTVPQLIPQLEDVRHISCSAGLTLALTGSGDLFAFGLNRWGQCGVDQKDVLAPGGKTNKAGIHVFDPVLVPLPDKVQVVDTGLQHCIALLKNGEVWAWGKGNRGQLGDGNVESGNKAVRVKFPSRGSGDGEQQQPVITQVSAGFNHTVALSDDGRVFVWGKGMSTTFKGDKNSGGGEPSAAAAVEARQAQIRLGKQKVAVYEDQPVPREITLGGDAGTDRALLAAEICCSNFTVVIRDQRGGLWAMGIGEYDRNTIIQPIPVQKAIREELLEDSAQSDLVVASPGVVSLQKGYQRVSVMDSSATTTVGHPGLCEYESNERAFEVVLHQGEAFLQVVEGLEGRDEPCNDRGVVAYATGWQHHMAVFVPR
jgi:alpha-tubulin suppressor-like RCC1 family protein